VPSSGDLAVARRHRSGGTGSVAVRFDDHDGAFGQHAFNPGKDVEERIDTFVDRIADAAQQQDAWPGCTGHREGVDTMPLRRCGQTSPVHDRRRTSMMVRWVRS
jgi:hypothetical protein